MLNFADLTRRNAAFSYMDGEAYVFMDSEDYTPYHLDKEAIADEALFINEQTEGLQVIVLEEQPVGVVLPSTVELEITECEPSVKGNSATARTKPASMSTGLVIQVPEHISQGDVIRINVEERKFLGRATGK